MKKPLIGALGPNDEYRYVRLAASNFLAALAKVAHEKRNKAVGAVSGFAQEEIMVRLDPVHQSAWYAEECAATLDEFTPGDGRYEFFEQLENACTSATSLTLLLRTMDQNA